MLQDRLEHACQTQDISPGGVALKTAVAGEVGERVLAYLDYSEGSRAESFALSTAALP